MLLRLIGIFLCAQVTLAQLPSGVDEQTLYQAVLPYEQYAQGYGGNGGSGQVERIDNQPVTLPDQQETRQGQDQTMDHQLQDERREGRVDQTKEIHNYQIQKRIINVNNRILHRYLKNLLVNTIYNTNIQKVNHQKLINLLLTTLQETHQPKLLVKYSRQDTTNDRGERQEQAEISEDRQDRVLPPVFVPATVEKIGYNGLGLGGAVSAGSNGGFSSGNGGFTSSGSSSSGFSSGSSSSSAGVSSSGSRGRYAGFSSGGTSGRYSGSRQYTGQSGGGPSSSSSSGTSYRGGSSLNSGSTFGLGSSAGIASGGGGSAENSATQQGPSLSSLGAEVAAGSGGKISASEANTLLSNLLNGGGLSAADVGTTAAKK